MSTSADARTGFGLDGPTVDAQDVRLQVAAALLTGAAASGSTGIAARQGVRPGLGSALLVSAASGMNITVNAGVAFIQGTASTTAGMYTACLDTAATLTVATADATNPRIDNVIARVVDNGDNTSTTTVELQTGAPNPSPTAPSLPANSLLLAQIAVAALASSIVSGNITDKRVFTAGLGGIIPVKTSGDQPLYAADAPAFRYRLDVTPAAGATSPVETTVNGTWHPVYDASVVPASTTSAINTAAAAVTAKALVCTSSTRPGSPGTGQEIFETDTGRLLVWNASTWAQVYPVPASGGWTNMTMQSGWTAGTGGNTPQYNYNATTKTVGIRGEITSTSGTGGTGNIVIANSLPAVSQIQYWSCAQVSSSTPIGVSISGGLLSLLVTVSLSSGDGVNLGGTYMAL